MLLGSTPPFAAPSLVAPTSASPRYTGVYLPPPFSPTMTPRLDAQLIQLFHTRSMLSVRRLPYTISPRFGRVNATFMRRQSPVKPTLPSSFERTALKMITSFSRPWKPSTVLISMPSRTSRSAGVS